MTAYSNKSMQKKMNTVKMTHITLSRETKKRERERMKRMVHDFVYGLSFSTTFTGSFSKPNPPVGNAECPSPYKCPEYFPSSIESSKNNSFILKKAKPVIKLSLPA